jgi:hypothetical protein
MEDSVASVVPSGGKKDTSHLAHQDISKLDASKLTPLSPEVISRQATINIGMSTCTRIYFIRSFMLRLNIAKKKKDYEIQLN